MKSLAIFLALYGLTGLAVAQDKMSPRVVRVIGSSEVRVAPDRAVVRLGVQRQAPNSGVAKHAEDAAARLILAAIRASGVDEKDVQTTYLSLQPESYTRKGTRISYFVAEQTMSVTVRDLSKIDSLLEALIKAGGNRIDSISYETSELRKYRDQARDLAMKAAREKADALARALGQEIGKAHSIEEVPESDDRTGMANNFWMARTPAQAAAASMAPGQKTISASVTVSFDLN